MTTSGAVDGIGQDVADAVRARGLTVAVAESLTGGLLSSALARAEDAGSWFRGGVVAYASEVKHEVLDVRPGPVVSEGAARDMACRVATLLRADLGLSVTGVGGPDEQDGVAPGTVWVAVAGPQGTTARLHHFDGGPSEVCEATVVAALAQLLDVVRRGDGVRRGPGRDRSGPPAP